MSNKICKIENDETLNKCLENNNDILINPLITKIITAPVVLRPDQLNNDLLTHMLNNLELLYKNKCFKDIGFIVDIIEIVKYSEGIIYPEQNDGNVQYVVDFKCKISVVIKNTIIIAKVEQTNPMGILLRNYPYFIIVENKNINNDKFEYISPNIKYINGDYINKGDYLKVKIIDSRIRDKENKITAIGYLEDIVSDDELEKFYDNIYNN